MKKISFFIMIGIFVLSGCQTEPQEKTKIGLFYNKYDGYVAFTEFRDNRYIVLVIKDVSKEEIYTKTDTELDKLAQESGKEYGTKGNYFSISKSDFNKIEKGQKVEVSYKKQSGPDIWGYPIKASSVKIIEE